MRHITDGYQVIDHELRRIKAKRLVIDSVTAYLLAAENELSRRNELKRLFDHMRKWKVTALLTAEAGQTDAGCGIEYMVDTIIRLHNRIDGGFGRR
jgi:KaiC/GvpD/RAD55 family RecA-like ATPase